MELRPLTAEEVVALRALVEEQVDLHLRATAPEQAFFRGGLYTAQWSLGCLRADALERVRWLLGEIGFEVGEVIARSVPADIPGVHHEFHTLEARRDIVFLPDCLWGEAVLIEGLACNWGAHVERCGLLRNGRRGWHSLHGPAGGDIA